MEKKLGLVLILAIVSTSVLAEWEGVGSTARADIYVDRNTIRKTGTTIKMWNLRNYKSLQNTVGSEPYWSKKIRDEYDCNEESYRMLYFSDHTEKMGLGVVAYVGDLSDQEKKWTLIPPGSVIETVFKVACSRE